MADRSPAALARMTGTLAMPPVAPTVGHMLLDAARDAPDTEALICGGRRLTYAQYANYAFRLAQWLRGKGAAGERVALLLGNSIEMAVASFAVHLSGAQAVLLNPAYTARELGIVLADAQPLLLLHKPAASDLIGSIAGHCGSVHEVGGGFLDGLPVDLEDFPLPAPASLATLQYTGGTTGKPKGVNLTHAAIATNVAQREALLPTNRGRERVLSITPLFHSYATAMGLHLCAHCASTLVIMPKYNAEELLELIARESITIFLGSPTLFVGLMSYPKFASSDFSSLRVCYSGSAALPAEILTRWEKATGCKIYEGYGQTEAGPVLTYNSPRLGTKPGSVGYALPETTIEIVDLENGERVLSQGESGEIRARGPQIMSGYRTAPEETARALRDGWLYTGDIGAVEPDGTLTIRGRKKEMIIVSGFNVFPSEVEDVLLSQGQVHEAAVVGVPDSYRGEIIHAFVVPKTPGLGEQELLEYCAANLTRYKLPAHIAIVASLPKTSVGKIDKVALAATAKAQPRTDNTPAQR
jgi:long-chain acyl-CoA synthetase